MNKTTTKILSILLFALLFIFTGFYLSTKVNQNKPKYFQIEKNLSPTQNPTTPKLFLAPTHMATSSGKLKAQVKRVIDGDTLELSDGKRVRYIGIDSPESVDPRLSVQCFGKEAAYFNQQLVEGQIIEMEKDISQTDKYGRLLRYVYLDGVFINELLVGQGYARINTVPPDIKYVDLFRQAEQEAREAKRGLWGKCGN